jgi:hypothetical protein
VFAMEVVEVRDQQGQVITVRTFTCQVAGKSDILGNESIAN